MGRKDNSKMKFTAAVLLLLAATLFGTKTMARAKQKPLQVVQDVDLKRYSGTWYEVARLPNWFERKCGPNVSATYTLNSDGTVKVENRCVKSSGRDEVAIGAARLKFPGTRIGHLLVTFAPKPLRALPFVWADYCIIELDAEYKNALVGEPGRKYLWVLSRDRHPPEETVARLLSAARQNGFDTSKIIRN